MSRSPIEQKEASCISYDALGSKVHGIADKAESLVLDEVGHRVC